MQVPVEDFLAAITHHTRGLAGAAENGLDLPVEHCPGWSVADLVRHVTEVHRFWNEVARDRPLVEPDLVVPERPADEDLVAALLAGVEVLTGTLRAADQDAPCWTWGLEENIGFITRHQVQEAAVHHWDAVNAVGGDWAMDALLASDAVEEFLTHSVANRRWPHPGAEPLGGPLRFVAGGRTYTVADGDLPGTLTHTVQGAGDGGAAPADLLLWLYRRVPDSRITAGPDDLLQRFRAFTSTD